MIALGYRRRMRRTSLTAPYKAIRLAIIVESRGCAIEPDAIAATIHIPQSKTRRTCPGQVEERKRPMMKGDRDIYVLGKCGRPERGLQTGRLLAHEGSVGQSSIIEV
jgi:hypothetical protein